MSNYRIPFNKPFTVGNELEYISQCIDGGQISGDGRFTKQCQRLLEEKFKAQSVLLTTSCTSALEMAALLCDLEPGDEVILPSYTFVSTANAFLLRDAKQQVAFVAIRAQGHKSLTAFSKSGIILQLPADGAQLYPE